LNGAGKTTYCDPSNNKEEITMASIGSRTLVLLTAGALCACGAPGPSERPASPAKTAAAPAGPPLSRDELVKNGDLVCQAGYARFDEIQKKPPANLDEAHAQTEAIIASTEAEMKGLHALHPPAEVAASYQRYLALREDGVQALRDGAKASRADDKRAYAEAQGRLAAAGPERARLAREIGFTICSQPAAPR
jgi:hypothetical protein